MVARAGRATLIALIACASMAAAWQPVPRLRALVIVVDGLRPDLITPSRTPHLAALGARGVVSRAYHSIVPTVTRVNASALVTGTRPESHGILDNTIYLPLVDSSRVLNTGDGELMQRADSVVNRQLLQVPTLPDLLATHGLRMAVASSGSSGSAYLLAGAGRAPMINATMVLPRALASAVNARLGPPVEMEGAPNLRANARAVDAMLRVIVDSLNPDVAMIWLSDPDHTAHAAGLGSMLADSAIRAVDREVGRLLAGLSSRGLTDRVTTFVVSDHGFSTQAGRTAPLRTVLAPYKDAVIEAGGAIYLRAGHEAKLADVVRTLQASPAVGALFTRGATATDSMGRVPGTLSFHAAGWAHARAGDVLMSANWSHAVNDAGIAGRTELPGTAGHGTTSPYDIRATFLAAGPDFRRGDTTDVPSANSDIAPTILAVLGLKPAPSMTGRVLRELWGRGSGRPTVRRAEISTSAALADGSRYALTLYSSIVGETRYLDSTRVVRAPAR
jgi:predicted AlkP superfamily pyrophosphatase or phosphodiesterase